jgi:hypothetical protein
VVFGPQGRNGGGALFDAIEGRDRAAQVLGARTPFRVFGMLRTLFRHLCRRPVGLAQVGPQGKRKHPRPNRKLTTELDADPIKLFLGAIDPMNTQDLCPRCGRSGFARADVMSWKAFFYVR